MPTRDTSFHLRRCLNDRRTKADQCSAKLHYTTTTITKFRYILISIKYMNVQYKFLKDFNYSFVLSVLYFFKYVVKIQRAALIL